MAIDSNKLMNRTGMAAAPERSREMLDGLQQFNPSDGGDALGLVQLRVEYAQHGGPIGTLPPPADQQKFDAGASAAPSELAMELLMDKLGARLAFERTGVRFYDALASKYEAYGGFDGGPSLDHIQHIWNEEFQHFKLLRECIEQLGGDSTAVTPAADIQATAGMGIGQVLTDPRTNLVQCLDAILVAELADNASWEALTILAQQAGQSDMAQQFEKAQQSEQEHVQMVKTWLSAAASVPGKRMAA